MQLNSGFSCNSVIWVSSLPDDEQGPTRRMSEDMESISQQIGFRFQKIDVSSVVELENLLKELSVHAQERNMRPLLHLDMHGNKEKGLLLNNYNEYCSWDHLSGYLREINIHTRNNLCVVGSACFGLRAIMPIKLQEATPFFLLLAPEKEVKTGFLENNLALFYRELFELGSIDGAYSRYLSDEFKYFHCEKMLFIVIARYIKDGCKGKAAQDRKERLLTDIFSQGMEKNTANLQNIRKKIKNGIRPDQALLDRYARVFLINRPCSFNMDQLLDVLDSD